MLNSIRTTLWYWMVEMDSNSIVGGIFVLLGIVVAFFFTESASPFGNLITGALLAGLGILLLLQRGNTSSSADDRDAPTEETIVKKKRNGRKVTHEEERITKVKDEETDEGGN